MYVVRKFYQMCELNLHTDGYVRKLYITYYTNFSLIIIMSGTNEINYSVDCEGSIEDYTVETRTDAKIT